MMPYSCRHYNLFRRLIVVFTQAFIGGKLNSFSSINLKLSAVAVLASLRIYALYDRSKRMLVFLMGIGAITAILCGVS